MTDTLVLTLAAGSLALSLLAAVWARWACVKADRIRASTESVDRMEMHRIAGQVAKRRPAPTPMAATFDLRPLPPADMPGWHA